MKKVILLIITVFSIFLLTGCDNLPVENNTIETNNSKEESATKKQKDDEIIDIDDQDNISDTNTDIDSTLINCDGCVFAFFKESKTIGDKLTNYTSDYNTLKDSKGNPRRRFLGFIIDGNDTIIEAYACGIEQSSAYCLKGTENGSAFEYNIGILTQVFDAEQCAYNSNSSRYTCIGETNGDTRADGYVSVHYDDNCHVFGKTLEHDVEIYCY